MSQYRDITQSKAEEITGMELPRSVSERRKILRKSLPYGVYVLADGSEILYNRDYNPIDSSGNPILDKSGKPVWINHDSQYFFYNDGCVPSENIEALTRITNAMKRKRNNPKESVRDLALKE
jgi:hypothetical protein